MLHRKISNLIAVSAALTVLVAVSADAQSPANGGDGKANPLGGPGLQVDLGYRYFNGSGLGSTYYNFVYQGTTLATHGTAFADAKGYNDSLTKVQDDSPALRLDLDRGVGKYSGSLVNALKLTSIPNINWIRGVAQVYGTPESLSSLGATAGIESVPIVPLRIKGVPNFFTIGIQGGTQPTSTATTESSDSVAKAASDVGIFAYRQYLAYAPLNVYSASRTKLRALASDLSHGTSAIDLMAFYNAVRRGDDSALVTLATTDPQVKTDIDGLTNAEKTSLLNDLTAVSLYTPGYQAMASLTPQAAAAIQQHLITAPSGTPQAILASEIDDAVGASPIHPDWRNDVTKVKLALTDFIQSGGLAAEAAGRTRPGSTVVPSDAKPENATSEQNTGYAASRKTYLTDYLKLPVNSDKNSTYTQAVTYINSAYGEKTSAKKFADLEAGNEAILLGEMSDLYVPTGDTAAIARTLFSLYEDKDRPAFVGLVQNTGQYYLFGDTGNGTRSRLNGLVSASLTVYQHPDADQRKYFRIRYDNGRDHAAPTTYLNQLTATVGLEFK